MADGFTTDLLTGRYDLKAATLHSLWGFEELAVDGAWRLRHCLTGRSCTFTILLSISIALSLTATT
ncbi:hypothetical protein D3C86_1577580 [compost metagenome]